MIQNSKYTPLSIRKISTSNQSPYNNITHLSPPPQFIKSPPLLSNHQIDIKNQYNGNCSQRNQALRNNFPKFFKKVNHQSIYLQQIKTHQKRLKKNPRVKLIQNIQRIINPSATPYQKYVLHSTKRLKIINSINTDLRLQNQHTHNNSNIQQQNHGKYYIPNSKNTNKSLPFDKASNYIAIAQSLQKKKNQSSILQQKIQQKRKKSQQSNRIFKGITCRSRKQSNTSHNSQRQRLSLELDRNHINNDKPQTSHQHNYSNLYSNHNNRQHNNNEEQFMQHQKINLYHSLVHGGHLEKKGMVIMPLSHSINGQYAKIDRSISPPPMDQMHVYRRSKPKQYENKLVSGQYKSHMLAGFPTKKQEPNQPQVLTIHLKKGQLRFRQSLGFDKSHKNSKEYYQPRPVPMSNVNIFKRPNTTIGNVNHRRHSQIEPW